MSKESKKRDVSIDVLRCIAMMGILIAHCKPNPFFVQLRGFDVVLMVFLSAICSSKFDKSTFNYVDYCVKRFMRLIIPVWIFLLVYFAGVYIFYYLPPLSEIAASFAFVSDKYVWIIRILFILSLLSPFICMLSQNAKPWGILIAVLLMCIVCEIVFVNLENKISNLILMTLPYCAVYIIGIKVNSFTRRQTCCITLICFAFFFGLMSYYYVTSGRFVPTSELKYPPRMYYLTYGVGATLFLWLMRQPIVKGLDRIKLVGAAKYIGSHSYWLYLWHIPFVDIVGNHFDALGRFCIIFTGAMMCVVLQNYMVDRFVESNRVAAFFRG